MGAGAGLGEGGPDASDLAVHHPARGDDVSTGTGLGQRGGGDRKGYQQDWRNAREALREIDADIAQGADMVMVKPALAYLDIIAAVRARVDVPVAAYHVSGEYSMLEAAAANGWIDHDAVALEHLTAIKRAGADMILTYFARWFAEGPGRM